MQAILCARPPRVIAPTPLTVECNMDGGVSQGDALIQAWLSSAVAIDACEELEPPNDAPAVFPSGCPSPETTTVTFSASDSCGNGSSADSSVDVQDTTPPATLLPADVVVECAGPDGAQVDLLAQAMDVCGDEFFNNSRTGASADASDTYPLGETVVAWDIFDECDNHSCGWTRVAVEDTTPPQVECSLAEDVLWPPNHDLVDVGLQLVVEDVCDPDPSIEITVTSDEHPATAPGTGGAKHCPDAIVCDDAVELRAERAGPGDGRVYTIQVEVTDASGNVGMCQTSVSVPHEPGDAAVDSGQDHDPTVCIGGGGNGEEGLLRGNR